MIEAVLASRLSFKKNGQDSLHPLLCQMAANVYVFITGTSTWHPVLFQNSAHRQLVNPQAVDVPVDRVWSAECRTSGTVEMVLHIRNTALAFAAPRDPLFPK